MLYQGKPLFSPISKGRVRAGGTREQPLGGKGDHSLSVHPHPLCHCHHTWGGFLHRDPPTEKGVTAPRLTVREGAKPVRVMAAQALLKAETPWGRGTVGQGWGQPQKLGLHPTDQAVHCKQVSLRAGGEWEKQSVKGRMLIFLQYRDIKISQGEDLFSEQRPDTSLSPVRA